MEFSVTTPALLFPTISLLLLAYTNRFIAIGNRIRNLHVQYKAEKNILILKQIKILRLRVQLVRDTQVTGIICLIFTVLTMFLIYEGEVVYTKYIFGLTLLLLMGSFILAGIEIVLSTKALNIQLKDLEEELKQKDLI